MTDSMDSARRVYCAGPLFNAAERGEMLRIAAVLNDAGFETFVPHSDGMEFAQLQPYLVAQGYPAVEVGHWLHAAIFALDVYQVVEGCGSLVFNMNGRVPDEGAVAEATMAWMLGKPVVLFKEDARSAIAGRDNPLLVGQCGFETVSELLLLPRALEQQIAERRCERHVGKCPPHVQHTVNAGRALWSSVELLTDRADLPALSAVVMKLFGPGTKHRAQDHALHDGVAAGPALNGLARSHAV